MSDTMSFTTRLQLENLCDRAGRLGMPQLPLFRAAADGLLILISIYDTQVPWPRGIIERNAGRPIVVLVGGDPGVGHPDPAPSEWAAAQRLKYWARAALVHGAGGEAAHYREAAAATLLTRRFCVIETTSSRARDWARFLSCPATKMILPTTGPHPIPEPVGVMQ